MNTVITPISDNFDITLQRVRRCSRYAQRLLDSEVELLPWLRANYAQPCNMDEMTAWLATMPVTDEDSLSCALRCLRKRVMLKLLARDLGGLANLKEVTTCMSALAELTVQRAQHFIMETLEQQYGQPIGELCGTPQQLLVVGMGKLGGMELNVSSDIDLIFVYPEDGNSNGSRNISNHDFFSRLGRRLINLISELTQDGYVFRVDMRLRPYGDSGPLVMSFAAVEEYLVEQGREWERYAWIKARVISPADYPATQELMQLVQPFIFRKYLDFGAFESMRKLHAQISQEVQRRDRIDNIKLGSGGIREIEFIAQVFQLIRGGRDDSLRIRPTLQVLQLLSENGQLPPGTVKELSEAYVFLRNLEHRLQYLDDQQTHDLPKNSEEQAVIAEGMGYPDYGAMLKQLKHHRSLVSGQFALIFNTQEDSTVASALWNENLNTEELQNDLVKLGYTDTTTLAERLLHIRDSGRYRQLPDTSRQRIDKLIPQFITLCAEPNNRDQTLPRILNLLESISRRASYLAFLAEYPVVLPRLIGLASASEWACEYLIKHPILLDELLDAREIYRAPDWNALDAELLTQLDQCNTDTERQMDVLRQFQHGQTFHLLAMDLQGLLPLETLSDHLSNLADLILRHVLQLCWRDARKRHQEQAQFAIIAYGKLGGRELGYAADLDLIFLYDDQHPDVAEIYARLAQRINTLLSSYTSAGRLYEIDLRLRPNGASGLMVSSIPAFAEYQQQHAWVWEHQALTRARFCTGNPHVGKQFETIRNNVLCKSRDLNELRQEIVAMRQKMLDSHPNDGDLFDIKHDPGGMVDIEFIVQFLVLAHAHTEPKLTANSGNLALLMLASKLGLIKVELAEAASNCYRTLRAMQHKMRLNNQSPCRIDRNEIDTASVITLWEELLGPRCQE
ncbi:Glutamine synthetase adenylyl-L-tyrosine phosphorylase / Glutamine synthetase adenylyl transferase [Candidatus Nitrotoga sp. BS]|uniref:bifunctional [glutamate--ammonia ligase]-adenylyl-L-tyrosine phosphorylase/[glutamate--ammonia-ligase] adenylyltransferase n=1 Tax=Candidatus Nitrotoga sp. BS TaxID=2890408 RepID=UPI001EF2772A|nr:bifunctional [glutamate--ammonia ligase]-adenylyl-L-tyrosine phosphorylase/[glutamate--ammonia-ligase] adenylyltransferase [Candidatus Nitrotoga sp. BS]CAH1200684.1 Glutamine synthetase adenylyl-L-tyrosine phosphorylase / Glutamine synthetase adenylyl transferase [Candidatus Nitrotoga sp. BS]